MDFEIKGFVPNSLVDWDGKVSSVIFLGGCNFKCKFCSNKDLVLEPEKLKSISFESIKNYLEKNKDFIDGVVITGGEPCLHQNLFELCKTIKKLGFKVKIDTNGSYPEILQQLLDKKLVDCVAMDIKTCFEKYKEITNTEVDIEKIKKSILIVAKFPEYEFRITMFPEIKYEDLIKLA
ncbi:MAG: anaerobic ribonucleoside-triphosphate reductase activating protein, partial [Candidatus Pacearchaeota archaeon]